MKKPTLLAIFTFLALVDAAFGLGNQGWTSNVWSGEIVRYATPPGAVTAQIRAKEWSVAFRYTANAGNFSSNTLIGTVGNVTCGGYTGQPLDSICDTNLPGVTFTNIAAWGYTQAVYYTDIWFGPVPAATYAAWSTGPTTCTVYNAGGVTCRAVVKTTAVTKYWDFGVLDILSLEAYEATVERWNVIAGTAVDDLEDEAWRPVYYRNAYTNLVNLKTVAQTLFLTLDNQLLLRFDTGAGLGFDPGNPPSRPRDAYWKHRWFVGDLYTDSSPVGNGWVNTSFADSNGQYDANWFLDADEERNWWNGTVWSNYPPACLPAFTPETLIEAVGGPITVTLAPITTATETVFGYEEEADMSNESATASIVWTQMTWSSSYWDWTPSRANLLGTSTNVVGSDFGRVQTNVWTWGLMTGPWTNDVAFTNNLTDACGDTGDYATTNGWYFAVDSVTNGSGVVTQQTLTVMSGASTNTNVVATVSTNVTVSASCTNTYIADGFTAQDYGYKTYFDAMNALVHYYQWEYYSYESGDAGGSNSFGRNTSTYVADNVSFSAAVNEIRTNGVRQLFSIGDLLQPQAFQWEYEIKKHNSDPDWYGKFWQYGWDFGVQIIAPTTYLVADGDVKWWVDGYLIVGSPDHAHAGGSDTTVFSTGGAAEFDGLGENVRAFIFQTVPDTGLVTVISATIPSTWLDTPAAARWSTEPSGVGDWSNEGFGENDLNQFGVIPVIRLDGPDGFDYLSLTNHMGTLGAP